MNTWYERIVAQHTVADLGGGEILLYVPFHIMNEYTSPQAFAGLAAAGRGVRRPGAHFGVVDHVNSTRREGAGEGDGEAELLIRTFQDNCARHGIRCLGAADPDQGIEHVIVPEQGLARPGMVIACGDSHTTTYGAFGALGFGIGTSEVEHILATQTLVYRPLRTMRVTVDGVAPPGMSAKDLIMGIIGRIGAGGANGFAVEFAGPGIEALDLAGRMTVCNMAVEMGARAALIVPDARVHAWLADRPAAVPAPAMPDLPDPATVRFDREERFDAAALEPLVTWGTSPDQVMPIGGTVPDPATLPPARRATAERALAVMGLSPGQRLEGLPIDMAFIGSCTNGRIEDLRAAAQVLSGRRVAAGVRAIIVPGSNGVRRQAEAEGLDRVFSAAGCEWRPASGCSMCLAMNDDVAAPGTRIASATNRNFEGRQGQGARTHLMSPAMVAAAAIAGRLADVRACAKERPS
jgi:3-isopropylmalate/(R)-2-methylmalate dehydratase large subunit